MTAVVEDQDVTAPLAGRDQRGVLVCHRGPNAAYSAEWTYWDSIEQAREAETEFAQPCCGPLCIGIHTAVRLHAQPEPRRRPTTPTTTTRTRT